MRKNIALIILLAAILLGNATHGADIDAEGAVQLVNNQIGIVYYDIHQINKQMWDKYEVLVYGGPQSVPAKDQDKDKNGEYRYLGYTPMGDLMPNHNFLADHPATTTINNYDWIKEPWYNEALSGIRNKIFDNNPADELYIKAALADPNNYGNVFDYNLPPKNADHWYEVTKILQPRTDYTPGLGRLWHRWDSNGDGIKENWYITVFIPAKLPPDVEVISLSNPSPVIAGTTQNAAVTYRNNNTTSQTATAPFYLDADLVKTENITLQAGQSLTRNYNWQAPDTTGQVTLKAEMTALPEETNTANNIKTLTVDVEAVPAAKEPECLPCKLAPSISNTWETVYSWEETHSSTYTDPVTGEVFEDSWTETIYETVTYAETLKASVTVHTGQGNPESTRTSRGSWEIIPWAQQNGLNPDEVTRSGYGFEVEVRTSYSTVWETKVPGPAQAQGGTYQGPLKVVADFYDTRGYQVASVAMEPTSGKAGDKKITWELPQIRHTFYSGETIYPRFHMTEVDTPDGKYLVRVTLSEAGKTGLCLILEKYVTIYGSMYDDTYIRQASENER
jgi:hypothetical protein